MSSFLNNIVDFSQLQHDSAAPGPSPSTPTPQRRQDSPATGDNNNGSSSDSEDERGEQDDQPPPGTRDSPRPVSAFAISTARNVRLTADGEKSLLQFSELDTKSAMIYQQAMLIKLNENYLRRESATTTQGSEANSQLVLTNEIKHTVDSCVRLVMLSPKLSRYRPLDKGLKTGPGAIVIEWLRTKSEINKRYFEGGVYQELRHKVQASCRYARNNMKDMIRRSVEQKLHITVLLRELTQSLEKWFKGDLKAPMAVAVRLAFLRQVYHQDPSDTFWKSVDKTLADIRLKTASDHSLSVSSILVKCLDSDERKYPATSNSTSAHATLASVQQSDIQSSMDEFVASSQASSR